LVRERALALGQAIDKSTIKNYSSALNSYLTFVRLHEFPVDPTPDTLSFFTVYTAYHIKPDSVSTYLSGICQQLEPFFPDVRKSRRSVLVERTLKGCKRMRGTLTNRKRALTVSDLVTVTNYYAQSDNYDDILFVTMLLTGFFALMRLGELSFPNDKSLRDWRKVTKRSSVIVTAVQYEFHLPSHKADPFFEGNRIIIRRDQFDQINPLQHFMTYLARRDHSFPASSALWLTSKGTVPTRDFFIRRLRRFFTNDIAGQSMRAGGATTLAENGVSPTIIQAIGRWKSEAFLMYIRKNLVLVQALLFSKHRT
jgi:hypothetical protein